MVDSPYLFYVYLYIGIVNFRFSWWCYNWYHQVFYMIDFNIEKNIKFNHSTRSPHFQMKKEELWPNVERMRPGDTYVIEYDKPAALKKKFVSLCVEKTGKTLEELNINILILANKLGIVILKL